MLTGLKKSFGKVHEEPCGFDIIDPRDPIENDLIALNELNMEIADLIEKKTRLVKYIATKLNLVKYDEHNNIVWVAHEGQQSQNIGRFVATFTTKVSYQVNKEEYEVCKAHMQKEFNPVRESVKYDVVNRKLENVYKYGDGADKAMLQKFLVMKYANPSITLAPLRG